MGGQGQHQEENIADPDVNHCLELVSQGWVKTEMEGKPLNFPSGGTGSGVLTGEGVLAV